MQCVAPVGMVVSLLGQGCPLVGGRLAKTPPKSLIPDLTTVGRRRWLVKAQRRGSCGARAAEPDHAPTARSTAAVTVSVGRKVPVASIWCTISTTAAL